MSPSRPCSIAHSSKTRPNNDSQYVSNDLFPNSLSSRDDSHLSLAAGRTIMRARYRVQSISLTRDRGEQSMPSKAKLVSNVSGYA